ncbi:hypothetical protein NL676_010916 [Syzygium grande]|nr:hypothetical protein NL676_010916 [Syzygium grande]
MRSPTSRVGFMEAEGINLWLAKNNLNIRLTVKAVKAAFSILGVIPEQPGQPPTPCGRVPMHLLHLHAPPSSPSLFTFSQRTAPPLSTSFTRRARQRPRCRAATSTLQEEGIIKDALIGEIPKMPIELAE